MFLRLSKTEATTLDKRKIHYSVGYCKSWYILKNSNVGNVRHILQKKKYPDSDMLGLSYYILYLLSTMNSLVEKKSASIGHFGKEKLFYFLFFSVFILLHTLLHPDAVSPSLHNSQSPSIQRFTSPSFPIRNEQASKAGQGS